MRILSFFLALFIFIGHFSAIGQSPKQEASASKTAQIEWLRKNAIRIDTIDPSNRDFADLKPLESVIGDSRIVMLGEQSHADGATFLAKTRLVMFLHEKMGFDILAFESGFFDCHKAWTFIQGGEDPIKAARRGIFGVWSSSKQVQSLFSYLGEAARTKRPLELAGFDMQFTGTASREFLLADLETFLRTHAPSIENSADWTLVKGTMESVFSGQPKWREYSPEQRNQFSTSVKNIQHLLSGRQKSSDLKQKVRFWIRTLANIDAVMNFFWSFDPQKPDIRVTNIRDAQMADNLAWLAETLYPKRKIIVWGATSHLIRNRSLIEANAASGMISMGQILTNRFGKQVYALGVTSYSGQTGLPFDGERGKPKELEPAERGSLEEMLYSAGLDYGIVDFRRPRSNSGLLAERISSRALGHSPMKANWSGTMDGILFIKEMKPSTKE